MVSIKKGFTGMLPNGRYKFVVTKVDADEYTPDNPNVLLHLEVIQNKNKQLNGMTAIKNLNFKPAADVFTRPFMEALGYEPKELDDEGFEFDTDEFVGRQMEADYEKNGKYANLENPSKIGFTKQNKVEN